MSATSMLVNGYDLKALGFAVVSTPHDSVPDKDWLTATLPDRQGATLLSTTARVGQRILTVPAAITATSVAQFRSNFDKLKYKLDAVPLTILLVDDQTRRFVGRLQRLTTRPPAARQFLLPTMEMDLEFLCEFPYRRDVSLTSQAFTSNTAMVLGTAPVRPHLIRLTASGSTVSAIVLTYKDAAGVTRQTMDFTGTSILVGDKIEIDCFARTIIKTVSGTPSDASTTLVGGDFFELDPQHGDFLAPTWPSLTFAKSGGTLTALCEYYKNWL